MRTFLKVVLSVVGGLLLVVGGGVAGVVGPDDTASLPPDEVPATSGVALTSSAMFPVRDLTLRVTAASEGGPVLLGAAHPVDARDYVRGVDASWLRGVAASGALTTDPMEGELVAPEVDPTTVTFWQDSVSGSGPRSLDVALTGEPVAFVVVPLGGPARTSVAFGVVVPHLFATALGTAALGALLVASVVVVARRGRRPAPTATAPPEPSPAPDAGSVATVARTRQAVRPVALGLGAALVLGACVTVPSVAEPPDEPTRIAVDDDELTAALASYGESRTAAAALAAQLDASGWAGSDTGALLALMQARGALDTARGEPPTASTFTYTALDVAVPQFTSYPMWFLALVEPTTDGEAGNVPHLRVLRRDRVTEPWRSGFAVELPADAVDLPGPGAAATATSEQVAAGLAGLEQLRTHLETGADVPVELGDLQWFREDVLGNDLEGGLTIERAQVAPFGAPEEPSAPGGPVQVVPVDGGVLVTAALTYDFARHVEPGWTVTLTDPAVAQVTRQTGDLQSVRSYGLVQAALLVPSDGTPRVLSAGWSLLVPPV